MAKLDVLSELHKSLDARFRPEDVATKILTLPGVPPAAVYALRGMRAGSRSYMAEDFFRPPGVDRQLKTLAELLEKNHKSLKTLKAGVEGTNTDAIRGVVEEACTLLKIKEGKHDFKHDRLNRDGRKEAGLKWLRKRQYNKLFRLMGRMDARTKSLANGWLIRNMLQISKSRLAFRLDEAEFRKDVASAAFIAYYTAMINRRSLFTNFSQPPPFDTAAKALYEWAASLRPRGKGRANWFAIAHVYPIDTVIQSMTDRQKGKLLGLYFGELKQAAGVLERVYTGNKFKLAEMIVQRGMDSSTWNMAAGAWNKLRDGWIGLVVAMGLYEILDHSLPGKVMRLMAADVARWHKSSGGDVHPDTKVWAKLPPPWQVLSGERSCSRRKILSVLKELEIEPEGSAWLGPRAQGKAVACSPTPELCHGIAVSSPQLASLFRKWGIFSGKPGKTEPYNVQHVSGLVNDTRAEHAEKQEGRRAAAVD
jgi:hypothetical protein